MSEFALALVLAAAVLHAVWNAIIKSGDDKAVVMATISAVNVAVGLVLVFLVDLPAPESWPYLIASTLIHYFYYAFLVFSYRLGDLSQVYPIARGIVPVLVALGALVFVGETLPSTMWLGIFGVSFGIAVLSLAGWDKTSPAPVLAALGTGLIIAIYSVVDGIGVRLSQSPIGYIGWLFIGEIPVCLFVFFRRRGQWAKVSARVLFLGLFGGLCAALAYGLVLYAKTIAPLGAVSAVRESSVIVAALIGTLLLGEHHWRRRIGAAAIVGIGILIIAGSG
ncbi:Integral membrane protein [hydrothermal vent metagenome]|uniref:Integral membrane protein n=1 Tax=hydrothermal vent metagenome TaxID=652676 RepID=A0A3B0TMC6_9ZZZZ